MADDDEERESAKTEDGSERVMMRVQLAMITTTLHSHFYTHFEFSL